MRKIAIIISIFLFLFTDVIFAVPRAALYSVQSGSESVNALVLETEKIVRMAIEDLGCMQIVETNELIKAASSIELSDTIPGRYFDISRQAGAQFSILFSIYQTGALSHGEIAIEAHDNALKKHNLKIRVESRILQNVPYLLLRELLSYYSKFPVYYTSVQKGSGLFLISAGTYSGIQEGQTYKTVSGEYFTVVTAGRYESYVKSKNTLSSTGELPHFADVGDLEKWNNGIIADNIDRRYGAAYNYSRRSEPVKQYMESLVVVNPLGNILLPGYGSYLNTGYMGFENPKPSSLNMVYTSGLYLTALLYAPVATKFSGNFFPWIQDSDKSDKVYKRQKFLWAMIPITFTVSYLDHLAIQYQRESVLPPGFSNPLAPYVHSLIIPGGGHFYRGDRIAGWSYYTAQSAALYFAFTDDSKDNQKRALLAMGGLKIVELLHLAFAKSSYEFYNREIYSESTTTFFSSLDSDFEGNPRVSAGFQLGF
ncbi:MAG TPA: hypothetical protein P5123_02515 [Spirochaetota bacterium]|nr:hypothetical protein [Spirochaetota bacterium]